MAIVTFTTDFGTADGYAGAMKGAVLSLAPDATLVDITHDIPARDIAAGAYALAHATPWFPAGTIHVAVVDPGVGGPRPEVIVAARGAFFIGPDNGLLAVATSGPRAVYSIEGPVFRRQTVSPTFHGRDVFAVAAGRLASGYEAAAAGPRLGDLRGALGLATTTTATQGEIIHVDAFGNLITSFVDEILNSGAWMLLLADGSFSLPLSPATTYADVPSGQPLVYRGSGGRLEIAVRDGSAAAMTGLARGDRIFLRRQP